MANVNIIHIKNLTKKFGSLVAVNNVTLDIREGEVFGLLGPNGAGKTTIINMVLSLLIPTDGKITVAGMDGRKDMEKIKQLIGLMTQETVVETDLTARENLTLFAELYHIDEKKIPKMVNRALSDSDLMAFADVKAGTFSGGMQRRLGLVRAMVHEPKILVLDEPTTGLDVQNRLSMWKRIKELNRQGTTVILTTQYLEEADELCNRIGIIDHGKVIALGTPSEIKDIVGDKRIVEIVTRPEDVQKVASILKKKFDLSPTINGEKVMADITAKHAAEKFTKISATLDKEGVAILSISLHLPTLDDVFIKLTGSTIRDTTSASQGNTRMDAAFRGVMGR